MVAEGEDRTIEGWLIYGAALNEGRKLFPGDLEYGRWVRSHKLGEGIDANDQDAALWAIDPDHPDRFGDTRRLHPRVRTVRGLWAKWNEANRTKPTFEEPTEAERETVRKLRAIYDDPAAYPHFKENVPVS